MDHFHSSPGNQWGLLQIALASVAPALPAPTAGSPGSETTTLSGSEGAEVATPGCWARPKQPARQAGSHGLAPAQPAQAATCSPCRARASYRCSAARSPAGRQASYTPACARWPSVSFLLLFRPRPRPRPRPRHRLEPRACRPAGASASCCSAPTCRPARCHHHHHHHQPHWSGATSERASGRAGRRSWEQQEADIRQLARAPESETTRRAPNSQ